MKIDGQYVFKLAAPDHVWDALSDPAVIAKALPGCEEFNIKEEGVYQAVIKMGISVIKGTYFVNFRTNKSEKPIFVLEIEGSSKIGFIKLRSSITVSPDNQGVGSHLTYVAEGEVGGPIAGVGNRILGGVAKRLVSQFFGCVEEQLEVAA